MAAPLFGVQGQQAPAAAVATGQAVPVPSAFAPSQKNTLAQVGVRAGGRRLQASKTGMSGPITIMLMGEKDSSKAQPVDHPVLTPTGWTAIGSLIVGDSVIGADGRPTEVIGVYPQGEKDIYEVQFTDGATVECCDEHLWNVATPNWLHRKTGFRTMMLKDFMGDLTIGEDVAKWRVPVAQPVVFDEKTYQVDPYVLGVLLGDGCLRGASAVAISSADGDIIERVSNALPAGAKINRYSEDSIEWRIVADGNGPTSRNGNLLVEHNVVLDAMRQMGLQGKYSYEKHIPQEYLFGSIAQRVALFQGLMDTDGCAQSKRGHGTGGSPTYSTTSPTLMESMLHLAESLGCTVNVTTTTPHYTHSGERREGRLAYIMAIKCPSWLKPFSCARKAAVQSVAVNEPSRVIKDVVPIGRKQAVCIRVANEDGLYLTNRFVVTHNTCSLAGLAPLRPKGTRFVIASFDETTLQSLLNHYGAGWVEENVEVYELTRRVIETEKDAAGNVVMDGSRPKTRVAYSGFDPNEPATAETVLGEFFLLLDDLERAGNVWGFVVDHFQSFWEQVCKSYAAHVAGYTSTAQLEIKDWGVRTDTGTKVEAKTRRIVSMDGGIVGITGYAPEEKVTVKKVSAGEGKAKTVVVREMKSPPWLRDDLKRNWLVLANTRVVREGAEATSTGNAVAKDTYMVEILTSKVRRFPKGANVNITGSSLAKFWEPETVEALRDLADRTDADKVST